jgi:hypothetical protein
MQKARPEVDKDDSYIRPGLENWDPNAPDPIADQLASLFRRVHLKPSKD